MHKIQQKIYFQKEYNDTNKMIKSNVSHEKSLSRMENVTGNAQEATKEGNIKELYELVNTLKENRKIFGKRKW